MKNIVSALGFGKTPCRLEVEFNVGSSSPSRAPSTSGREKGSAAARPPVYTDKDTIRGRLQVIPLSLKGVDHLGIRVQLFGEVVVKSHKHKPHEFLSMVQDVAPPGDIMAIETLDFEFKNVEMPHESYHGGQVSLRYGVRVFLARSMGQTVIQDRCFDVRNLVSRTLMVTDTKTGRVDEEGGQSHGADAVGAREAAQVDTLADGDIAQEPRGTSTEPQNAHESKGGMIKMEVGIEDCLHIEFVYGKDAYHLKDVVVGRINFVLVRIKLKHMELEIKRREVVGSGIDARLESTTVAKFEIMDGAPTKGESIPIRMYLSPYPLTPSYENVENKFSVKYGLNLVLVDEEDRRYFKQHEIRLYRVSDEALGVEPAWNLFSGVNGTHAQGKTDEEVHGETGVLPPLAAPEEENLGDAHETGIDDGFSHIPL